jgi:Rod binding domain-containing protein
MSINSVLPASLALQSGAVQGAAKLPDPKAHGAAQQFESLLVAQLLKSTHQSGGGWMGTGDDQSGQTAMDYAEEQFASAIVAGGGLGLTKMIEKSLASPAPPPPQKLQD